MMHERNIPSSCEQGVASNISCGFCNGLVMQCVMHTCAPIHAILSRCIMHLQLQRHNSNAKGVNKEGRREGGNKRKKTHVLRIMGLLGLPRKSLAESTPSPCSNVSCQPIREGHIVLVPDLVKSYTTSLNGPIRQTIGKRRTKQLNKPIHAPRLVILEK